MVTVKEAPFDPLILPELSLMKLTGITLVPALNVPVTMVSDWMELEGPPKLNVPEG